MQKKAKESTEPAFWKVNIAFQRIGSLLALLIYQLFEKVVLLGQLLNRRVLPSMLLIRSSTWSFSFFSFSTSNVLLLFIRA
jgi:hypothetical protein